jgi:all-trans-retinol dehydrogenase (NAD+)
MYNGWLTREGFTSDVVFRWLGRTAFNPLFTLPILLLAKFTKKGEDLSILHNTAFSRLRILFYLGVIRYLNRWYNSKVLNNWTDDKYDWNKEIVLVTGGSGGIGGHIVQFLAEKNIKVVILDIQPPATEQRKVSSRGIYS